MRKGKLSQLFVARISVWLFSLIFDDDKRTHTHTHRWRRAGCKHLVVEQPCLWLVLSRSLPLPQPDCLLLLLFGRRLLLRLLPLLLLLLPLPLLLALLFDQRGWAKWLSHTAGAFIYSIWARRISLFGNYTLLCSAKLRNLSQVKRTTRKSQQATNCSSICASVGQMVAVLTAQLLSQPHLALFLRWN